MALRVALLGGSFNPPHVGHLMAAYWTLATQDVDKVWLMPAFRHPFGKELVPFEHRMAMCELAARDLAKVEVSRIEAEVGGEGRTVETLEFLRRTHPEIEPSLVVGSDVIPERDKWFRFEAIQKMARLIVVHRAGYDVAEAPGPVLAQVSSTEIRRRLEHGQDVSLWVPRAVAAYAQAHRLYRP